jgi:hypothetical protein
MAKKFRLLLLDANIVAQLFKLDLWDRVVEVCDVHLSRTVAHKEAHMYEDEEGQRQDFDLTPYIESDEITVFDVSISQTLEFTPRFPPNYTARFDPGELESLVYLVNSPETCLISSADSIVFRTLGFLELADQGLSLEELLHTIGLSRKLSWPFSKAFRERNTQEGWQDGFMGS